MREIPGFKVNPTMDDGSVIIRKARKQYRCSGGHNGQRRTVCALPIDKGSLYVEYIGEAAPFSSGERYHATCGAEQGVLIKEGTDNA